MAFKYFNPNPDVSLFKSGKPKNWTKNDSCIRAICKATNNTWENIFTELYQLAIKKYDMIDSKNIINEYCEKNNFTYVTYGKPKQNEKRPTVFDFANKYKIGTYILYLRNYYVCVKDGVIYNVCDVKNESIYSYWKYNDM